MNIDSATIDRIVAGVLNQLTEGGERAQEDVTAGGAKLTADVVTAGVLLGAVNGQSRIVVSEKAIVTPAAWDTAKERGVEIVRSAGLGDDDSSFKTSSKGPASEGAASPLLIIVRNTEAVERIWDEMKTSWRRELLGCPDDAATLATSAVCRGDAEVIVILAEQTHRVACLANRNERIKAVAVNDSRDLRTIKQQLRANVWCLDPTERSWFELRRLLQVITTTET